MKRWPVIYVFFPVAIAMFGACVTLLWKAAVRRASDLVFSAEGISIEGGPFNGRAWRWSDMNPRQSWITTDLSEWEPGHPRPPLPNVSGAGVETRFAEQLVILVIQGVRIATSRDAAEQATFAAVLDAVRAGCAKEPQAPMFAAQVLTCAGCGAAVAPADVDTVACHCCSAAVPVPDDLRVRIRDAESNSAERVRSHRLAARLMIQPGASLTNGFLSLLWAAAYVGIWATLSLLVSHHPTQALAPLGLSVLALGSARLAVASRKALRVLVVGFAARPPLAQGAPCTCRRCGAPLGGPPDGRAVSRCVYCRTTNVLVTLPRSAATAPAEEETASELELALTRRRHAGLGWLVIAAIGAAMIGVGVFAE
jgi:hypothetical protein